MFKLALTAGHYKYTAGKRCLKSLDPNETREWVLNDRICDLIEEYMKAYDGIKIIRCDDTNGVEPITLRERTDKANNAGADFYLSIHHNAGICGGRGGGIVAYVYTKAKEESKVWQKALYNELIALTGLKGNRASPLASANFHECRETFMPAVLLELGFMDSQTDVPVILTKDYAEKCARAVCNVVARRAGLKKKTASTSAEPAAKTESSQKATDVSYTVKVKASALNIRKGPGTNYGTNGMITDKGVYTIVSESDGTGASKWGKLKSGAGWISLDYTERR